VAPERDGHSSGHMHDGDNRDRNGGGRPNIVVTPDSFSGPRLHGLVPNISVEPDHHFHHHHDNHDIPIYVPYPVYSGFNYYGFQPYSYYDPYPVVWGSTSPQVVYVPQAAPEIVYVPQPAAPAANPAPDTGPPPSDNGSAAPDTAPTAPNAGQPESGGVYMPYDRGHEPAKLLPNGVEQAIVDIQEAWVLGDESLLARHIDPAYPVRLYREGKFDYSTTSENFLTMTKKALGAVVTQSYVLNVRTSVADDRVRACGTHVFYDPAGKRQTLFLCYWLQQIKDRWIITAIDTATSADRPLTDPGPATAVGQDPADGDAPQPPADQTGAATPGPTAAPGAEAASTAIEAPTASPK
jgi:hypothetical protein